MDKGIEVEHFFYAFMDQLEPINKISFAFRTDLMGVGFFFKEEATATEWLNMLTALKNRDSLKKIPVRPLDITGAVQPLNLQEQKYFFTFEFERMKLLIAEQKRRRAENPDESSIIDQSKL